VAFSPPQARIQASPSVHQTLFAEKSFVVAIKICIFVVDESGLIFENHVVTISNAM